jgi:hypothetical protein
MNVLAMWIQMDAGRADLFIEFTSLDFICLGDRQSNNYKLVVGVTGKEYVRTYVRTHTAQQLGFRASQFAVLKEKRLRNPRYVIRTELARVSRTRFRIH